MRELSSIFLAYDVRGKVGTELTTDVVTDIGRAFGDFLPTDGPVAVGYDMRPDSQELAEALMAGLTKQGREVWNIGQVSTDMIYFAAGKFNLAGGAMVTASHNPGEYNGIKFCQEEAKPVGVDSGLNDVQTVAEQGLFNHVEEPGKVVEKDVIEDWLQHVLSFIDVSKLKPLRVAVDAGNGMMGKVFAELEPYVPFEVTELFFELDGTFPNHIANPLDPKNLVDVQRAVTSGALDAGLAFDGDGDRAVLVDEKGEAVSGTVMTALLAEYFLSKAPGATILHNAICGRAAIEAIKKNGGKPVRTRVGHSFIKGAMREHNAIFAGEHSSHFFFEDNWMADSGLIAAVIGLYILSISGKSLSELAAPFRHAHVQIPETNFEVANKEAVMEKIAAAFKDGKQDWLDGLTVNYPDSWFNVRPSNTEPLLRLNAEATTERELDTLVGKIKPLIS